MAEPPTTLEASPGRHQDRGPRAPTLLDALAPIVVLILLLALTISLFGISATDGPLQVALLLSAAFASLVAFKNGYTVAGVADAAVGGVSSAIGAVFILLAVGALIGSHGLPEGHGQRSRDQPAAGSRGRRVLGHPGEGVHARRRRRARGRPGTWPGR